MRAFGDRWMAEGEIENIRQWESKNTLDSTLSNNYGSCLEFFVQNELVYASSWTSYGNPREYTLFPSLQELLFIAIFNNTAEAFTFEKKWHNRGREGENYAAQRSSKIDLRSIRQRC